MIVAWPTGWRPRQLLRPAEQVTGVAAGPSWSGADIGSDNRRRKRNHGDATEEQRQDGVTMRERSRGEAGDEDSRHDRIAFAAAIELLVGAFRRVGDQRRPIRPNVAHPPIVAPDPTSSRVWHLRGGRSDIASGSTIGQACLAGDLDDGFLASYSRPTVSPQR